MISRLFLPILMHGRTGAMAAHALYGLRTGGVSSLPLLHDCGALTLHMWAFAVTVFNFFLVSVVGEEQYVRFNIPNSTWAVKDVGPQEGLKRALTLQGAFVFRSYRNEVVTVRVLSHNIRFSSQTPKPLCFTAASIFAGLSAPSEKVVVATCVKRKCKISS